MILGGLDMTAERKDNILRDTRLSRDDIEKYSRAEHPLTLINCDLDESNLSDLYLSGWIFDTCRLKQSSFEGANLQDAEFLSCKAPFASFVGANLMDSVFKGGDYNNSNFKRSVLTSAQITGCRMTGTNFSEARSLGLKLEEVVLCLAKFTKLSFRKMTLKAIDFSDADLLDCDFRETIFDNCSLRDTYFNNCRFEGADLRGADLGDIKLFDLSRFKGAIISQSQATDLLSQIGLIVC